MVKNNSNFKNTQDLEDLQRYIQEMIVFLPLPFCTANPLNVILVANQAFQELTGYGEMEAVGIEIKDLFFEKKKISSFQRRVFKEDKRISEEMTLVTKNKKKIPVSVSALARKDEKENFVGYFLTISDISETKKFQEELEKRVEERTRELREKVEELERFHKLTVGRELKMIELKEEVERLKKEIEK